MRVTLGRPYGAIALVHVLPSLVALACTCATASAQEAPALPASATPEATSPDAMASATPGENDAGEGDSEESGSAAARSQAQDEAQSPPLKWSAVASAGISARDAGPDGTWQSLALARNLGRGYVRASVMRYHGTLIQADTALPSDYVIGTVAAGGNFDNWVTDGWISYGRQNYGEISTASGSRESNGSKSSPYFAAGGDFGRIFTLAPSWYVTPTVTISYAHGKLLRPAPEDTDLPDLETDEPTLTGGATVRLDHAFGPQGRNFIGLLASRQWSSNGVSALLVSVDDGTDAIPDLKARHYPDSWFEAGATASMSLLPRLDLDLYATRSFGMKSGNVTSAGLSLRTRF